MAKKKVRRPVYDPNIVDGGNEEEEGGGWLSVEEHEREQQPNCYSTGGPGGEFGHEGDGQDGPGGSSRSSRDYAPEATAAAAAAAASPAGDGDPLVPTYFDTDLEDVEGHHHHQDGAGGWVGGDRQQYYEGQNTDVILDPNLHGLPVERNRDSSRRRRRRIMMCVVALALVVGAAVAIGVSVGGGAAARKNGDKQSAEENAAATSSIFLPSPPADLEERCNFDKDGAGFTNAEIAKDAEIAKEETEVGATIDTNGKGDAPVDTGECFEVCHVAECCNLASNFRLSCLLGNEDTCYQYHKHCQVLSENVGNSDGSSSSNNGDGGSGGGAVELPPLAAAPANLKQICTFANLETAGGWEACESACAVAECCFSSSSPRDGNPGLQFCGKSEPACEGYSPCLHFLRARENKIENDVDGNDENINQQQQTIKPAPEKLAQKCSPQHFKNRGKAACRKACNADGAHCCWGGNVEPCKDQNACPTYQPCLTLRAHDKANTSIGNDGDSDNNDGDGSGNDGNGSGSDKGSDGNVAQNNSNNGNDANDGNGDNDGDNGNTDNSDIGNDDEDDNREDDEPIPTKEEIAEIVEDAYEDEDKYEEDEIPVAAPAPDDITMACSAENMQTMEGKEDCETRCLDGVCCFVEALGPCPDPSICPGYAVCETMQQNNDGGGGLRRQ